MNTKLARVRRRYFGRRNRNGNAIIETFFGLQIILWASFGMAEFGQFIYIKHCFEGSARDGARTAILTTATWTSTKTAITNRLTLANVTFNTGWLTVKDLDTGTSYTESSNSGFATVPAGDRLQVQLSTNYTTLSNVFRPLNSMTGGNFGIKNGKLLTTQCTMIKE